MSDENIIALTRVQHPVNDASNPTPRELVETSAPAVERHEANSNDATKTPQEPPLISRFKTLRDVCSTDVLAVIEKAEQWRQAESLENVGLSLFFLALTKMAEHNLIAAGIDDVHALRDELLKRVEAMERLEAPANGESIDAEVEALLCHATGFMLEGARSEVTPSDVILALHDLLKRNFDAGKSDTPPIEILRRHWPKASYKDETQKTLGEILSLQRNIVDHLKKGYPAPKLFVLLLSVLTVGFIGAAIARWI